MTWKNALERMNGAILDTFGEEEQPRVNATTPIDATFSRRFIEAEDFAGYRPLLECREADAEAAGLRVGATVTVRGQLYTAVIAQPDGEGWVLFVLEEA